jgi:hypothetical protein
MDAVLYGRYNDNVVFFCLSALSLLCMSAFALIAGEKLNHCCHPEVELVSVVPKGALVSCNG